MNEEYNTILNNIKKSEEYIFNNLFYDGEFYSGIINNYNNTKVINIYDIKSILKLYFFIKKNINLIENLIHAGKIINYKSIILEAEFENLKKDYELISKYKNNYIINKTLNSSEKDTDENIIKKYHLLYYCNPKYIDNILEYLPDSL